MLEFPVKNLQKDRAFTGRIAAQTGLMPGWFSLTLLVSSALLFVVQPMFARMALPLLGGTPAVWNTCMVFFQAALLAGYAYAHTVQKWLGTRQGLILHLLLLLPPFLVLPIALPRSWLPPHQINPVFWLLAVLALSVGLPFFIVSATAPLVQRWFASTAHHSARDPYFLYSASNVGSMAGLLAYPLLLEPFFSLQEHARLWTIGYVIFVVLMAGCATFAWRSLGWSPRPGSEGRQKVDEGGRRPSPARSIHWILLAFVPSSLMLSVTTYLTTDIAAIPLLWVLPLSLYLFSFIIAFARRPILPRWLAASALPRAVLILILIIVSEATEPIWLLVFLHLLAFFVVALVCHGQLADDRPAPRHLTMFYLLLSTGGVLGGLFTALVAPMIFAGVAEYPLVLIMACFLVCLDRRTDVRANSQPLRQHLLTNPGTPAGKWDLLAPLLLGVLTAVLILTFQSAGLAPGMVSIAVMFALPVIVCYVFIGRPLRFALGTAAILGASLLYHGVRGTVLYRERSFFGIHRVTISPDGATRQLVHGNTVHGRQDPRHPSEPLSYYFRTGPIGQVFDTFLGSAAKPEVAIVGLGAGSLAAYGQPGQHFTFFEIDPSVVRIAENKQLFSYLSDSRAEVDIVLGDARLTLRDASDQKYGLLVIDAFSSDSIPLHLLTREALGLYLSKLADDGILAFNISNRYLDLEPVLAALAQDAGLACLEQDMLELPKEDLKDGKSPSQWVIMARRRDDFGPLPKRPQWRPARTRRDVPVWTDNFSNLFKVFRWD
jgi:hypothetical protein